MEHFRQPPNMVVHYPPPCAFCLATVRAPPPRLPVPGSPGSGALPPALSTLGCGWSGAGPGPRRDRGGAAHPRALPERACRASRPRPSHGHPSRRPRLAGPPCTCLVPPGACFPRVVFSSDPPVFFQALQKGWRPQVSSAFNFFFLDVFFSFLLPGRRGVFRGRSA